MALMGAVVFLGAYAIALESAYEKLTHDWPTIWSGVSASAALFALAAFSMTAIYSRQQIDEARRASRVTTTTTILDSKNIQGTATHFNNFLRTRGSVPAAKAWFDAERGLPVEKQSPEYRETVGKFLGAYSYLATLYNANVFDNAITLQASAQYVSIGAYLIKPELDQYIRVGIYDPAIRKFAEDCLTEFRRRPQVLVIYPYLDGFTI